MNKLKNILSFFPAIARFADCRLFAVFAVDGTGTGKNFLSERLLSVHALLRDQKTGFEPHLQTGRKVEYWAAFITFYCVSFYILGLTLKFF